jgi:hypothetical protein
MHSKKNANAEGEKAYEGTYILVIGTCMQRIHTHTHTGTHTGLDDWKSSAESFLLKRVQQRKCYIHS